MTKFCLREKACRLFSDSFTRNLELFVLDLIMESKIEFSNYSYKKNDDEDLEYSMFVEYIVSEVPIFQSWIIDNICIPRWPWDKRKSEAAAMHHHKWQRVFKSSALGKSDVQSK